MQEIGAKLRRRRESRGLTIEQAEAATKIRGRYLEALEAGRPEVIPGEVFARGFLRSYATYLGLDADELVDAYKAWQESVAAAQHPEPGPGRRRRPPPSWPWVALGVLLVAAALGTSLVHRPPAAAPAAAPPAATSRPAGSSAATAGRPTPPAAPGPAAPAPAPNPATPAKASLQVSASGDAVDYSITGGQGISVQAAATARCWVRVWVDDSQAYQDATLLPGDHATWQAKQKLVIRVGFPVALQLQVDGLDAAPLTTQNPLTLTFTRAG